MIGITTLIKSCSVYSLFNVLMLARCWEKCSSLGDGRCFGKFCCTVVTWEDTRESAAADEVFWDPDLDMYDMYFFACFTFSAE